jgi:hypothetical protein
MENKLNFSLNSFSFELNNESKFNNQNFENILSYDFNTFINLMKNESFLNLILNEKEIKLIRVYQFFLQYIKYTHNHLNEKKNNLTLLLTTQNQILKKSEILLSHQIKNIDFLKNSVKNTSDNIIHFDYLHKFISFEKNKEEDEDENTNNQSDGEIVIN